MTYYEEEVGRGGIRITCNYSFPFSPYKERERERESKSVCVRGDCRVCLSLSL